MDVTWEDAAGADPGLFGAVMIALVAGWLARRLLARRPSVFACVAVGAGGTVLGLVAAGALSLPVSGALGLFAAALGGAVFIQAMAALGGTLTGRANFPGKVKRRRSS